MKRILLVCLFVVAALSVKAQSWIDIGLSVRADYQHDWNHDDAEDTGFRGKYLNLDINGRINDDFSFSLRQRLNKAPTSDNPFNATDWINLTYRTRRWAITAGKMVYEMGGYEYYNAPIDIYFASLFWNNIACYQFGVAGTYTTGDGKHSLMAQLTQSPYAGNVEKWFSYNLSWAGSMGVWHTRYSTNFAECADGKFIHHIVLGNRFELGRVVLEADFFHRANLSGDYALGKNFSVVAKVVYDVTERVSLFGKAIYDKNSDSQPYDMSVAPDTEYVRYGGGVEFFPIKGNRKVRLHLNTYYSHGDNPHPSNPIRPNGLITDVGVTWKISLLKR
jgi:hypothetical protein